MCSRAVASLAALQATQLEWPHVRVLKAGGCAEDDVSPAASAAQVVGQPLRPAGASMTSTCHTPIQKTAADLCQSEHAPFLQTGLDKSYFTAQSGERVSRVVAQGGYRLLHSRSDNVYWGMCSGDRQSSPS
jgi:hypothetical protein